MNDMSSVIVPKSDQINADDLIAGPRTIRISDVHIAPGTEQPVTISYDGDDGRPWKPCKTMSRLLVTAWGPDAKAYVGRSVTLYRDPNVKWGGLAVGGIRVSHMTDIPPEKLSNGKMVVQLTETRGKRSPVTVQALTAAVSNINKAAQWTAEHIAAVAAATTTEALDALTTKGANAVGKLQGNRPELHAQVLAAYEEKRSQLAGNEPGATMADPFDTDGPTDNSGFIAGIEARIESATTLEQLDEVHDDLREHGQGLDDADYARLEAAVLTKKRKIGRGT